MLLKPCTWLDVTCCLERRVTVGESCTFPKTHAQQKQPVSLQNGHSAVVLMGSFNLLSSLESMAHKKEQPHASHRATAATIWYHQCISCVDKHARISLQSLTRLVGRHLLLPNTVNVANCLVAPCATAHYSIGNRWFLGIYRSDGLNEARPTLGHPFSFLVAHTMAVLWPQELGVAKWYQP